MLYSTLAQIDVDPTVPGQHFKLAQARCLSVLPNRNSVILDFIQDEIEQPMIARE